MYKVNKYVPNSVDDSGIETELVDTAEAVLQTRTYKDAVGDRQLYWNASSPSYLEGLVCDLLFFVHDDKGSSWGALHVVTDTLDEMYRFMQVSHAKVESEKTAPKSNPSKFYLISFNTPVDVRLERIIKDTFQRWMHYMKCNWIVLSDKSVKDISSSLLPWIKSCDEDQLLLVTEIDPTNINGWLPQDAWNWLSKNQMEIMYKEMDNPSLTDMYNYGIFNSELQRARTIADVDKILQPYETRSSQFELEWVRNRMVQTLTARLTKNAT